MKHHPLVAILFGALVGAFYWLVLMIVWGSLAADLTFTEWLRSVLPQRDDHELRSIAIYSRDVILNILLAVPFASMLALATRLNSRLTVAAAVTVMTVATYWGTVWDGDPPVTSFWQFWFGLGLCLLSLPAAFVIVRAVNSRWLSA